MRLFVTVLAFSLFAVPLSAAEPTLAETLKPIIDAHKGKVAIAVKNLATGEAYEHNPDEVMQTASLIKLAIMVEAYRQADEKTLDITKMMTLTKEDKVPGAGILTDHFSDGAMLSIRDGIRLMIRYSDNTATNMVLDRVGIQNVNINTVKLGIPETRINSKVYKRSSSSVDFARSEKYQLGSTTAKETLKLLELIHTEKAASAESCKTMIAHLKANDDKELLVRYLPTGTVMAHKTGATNQVRNDAGIVYVPDATDAAKKRKVPAIVVVLTNENEDQRWVLDNAAQVTIAKIGKAVYEHVKKSP